MLLSMRMQVRTPCYTHARLSGLVAAPACLSLTFCCACQVVGLDKKKRYHGRFEELMGLATEVFNKLLERATEVPRNYIIDQTK